MGGRLPDRLKNWFHEEQKKLEGKTGRQKAQYILEYYWIEILAAAAALSFLVFFVYRMNFVPHENWFYGIFANTASVSTDTSALGSDFAAYAGYDLKEKNLVLNAASWFAPSKPGGTNNSYFQAFAAVTEAGDLDVVTMGREDLEALGSSGRLLDLNDESCLEIRKRYEDRFVYCIPYDETYSTDPVPVGIDISDSLLVKKYHFYEDDCVLGIGAYSKHMDSILAFLELITGEMS